MNFSYKIKGEFLNEATNRTLQKLSQLDHAQPLLIDYQIQDVAEANGLLNFNKSDVIDDQDLLEINAELPSDKKISRQEFIDLAELFEKKFSPQGMMPLSPFFRHPFSLLLNKNDQPIHFHYDVVGVYPHNPNNFTEGLIYEDGVLYEASGQSRSSKLTRTTDLETNEPSKIQRLDDGYFGEGIAIRDNLIYQLTYKNGVIFVRDKTNFKELMTYELPAEIKEGWGLAYDGKNFIVSNGSSTLYFLDPDTMEIIKQIDVKDPKGPVTLLNELEFIDGMIYANKYDYKQIYIIDPNTGSVAGLIDLTELYKQRGNYANGFTPLNGIAYDKENCLLFITGKNWEKIFAIRITQ